jgi:hypothetical protein
MMTQMVQGGTHMWYLDKKQNINHKNTWHMVIILEEAQTYLKSSTSLCVALDFRPREHPHTNSLS